MTPAAAQVFNNQVNATALSATNTGNVTATGQFDFPQNIVSGIGNNIGANATGAVGFAGVNQTISQSSIQQGTAIMPGNSVTVGAISATSKPNTASPAGANIDAAVSGSVAVIGTPNLSGPFTATGGGIANSIGASASGAVASASIVQSFDTNGGSFVGTGTDFTSLAGNQVKAGAITATNAGTYIDPNTNASVVSTVLATMSPGALTLIGDGIGNSIATHAGGAIAGASISASMLDNVQSPGFNPAATNVVQTGAVSATNHGAVIATYGNNNFITDPGIIVNGSGNVIGAFAAGASAGANVTQSIDFSVAPTTAGSNATPNQFYVNTVTTGAISAVNGKTGTVTALLGGVPLGAGLSPVPVAEQTISTGVGNAIVAQATGAGAGGTIVQRFANVNPSNQGLLPAYAASNSVTTGPISATNRGAVSAYATTFSQTGLDSALISGGTGNAIGAIANGASASLGIAESVNGGFMVVGGPVDNTAKLVGSSGLTARNGGTAIVSATYSTPSPTQITGGTANLIGAEAVGASASASIAQSIFGTTTDSQSIGANTVTVKDTGTNRALVATTGSNTAVVASFTLTGTGPVNILDGVGNSVSAMAVGSSVNASISSVYDNTMVVVPPTSTAAPLNQVNTTAGDASGNLFSSNHGTVTAIFAPPFNGNTGDLVISGGVGNSIGASAVGGSASASISQTMAFESLMGGSLQSSTQNMFANDVKTGNIVAKNDGAVGSALVATGNVSIGAFPLNLNAVAGVGNSISAQGVGAVASASISSRFYNVVSEPSLGLVTPATNTIKAGNIAAVNNADGAVTASATISMFSPNSLGTVTAINNGVSNFIGSSAVGASAGAGINQSVSGLVQGVAFNTTYLPDNSVTAGNITATNAATLGPNNPVGGVVATLSNTGLAQIGAAAPGFSAGNVGNSISANAIGASASASITTEVFNVTLPSAPTNPVALSSNTVKVASLSSTNSGPVTSSATFSPAVFNPAVSIGGGVNNSVGAFATGASSIASINQVTSTVLGNNSVSSSIGTLNTLASNTIGVGSITAQNSGPVTSGLAVVGFGGAISTISGGVGNAISANAVGASAGVSISQAIANVR